MFERFKPSKEDLLRKSKKATAVGALALTMGGGLSACGEKVDAKPGTTISATATPTSEAPTTSPSTPVETPTPTETDKNTVSPERMSEVIKMLKEDPSEFESNYDKDERMEIVHDYIVGELSNKDRNTPDSFTKSKFKPYGIPTIDTYTLSGAADYVSDDPAVRAKANIFYDKNDTLDKLEAKRVILGMVANQIPDSYADNDTTIQDNISRNTKSTFLRIPELQEQPGAAHINSTTFKSPSIANLGTGLSQLSKGKNEVGEYVQYKADNWSTYHVQSITVYTGVETKSGDKVNIYLENTSAGTRNNAINKAIDEAATE